MGRLKDQQAVVDEESTKHVISRRLDLWLKSGICLTLHPSEEESTQKVAHLMALLQPTRAVREVQDAMACEAEIKLLRDTLSANSTAQEQAMAATNEKLTELLGACTKTEAAAKEEKHSRVWLRFVSQLWMKGEVQRTQDAITDALSELEKGAITLAKQREEEYRALKEATETAAALRSGRLEALYEELTFLQAAMREAEAIKSVEVEKERAQREEAERVATSESVEKLVVAHENALAKVREQESAKDEATKQALQTALDEAIEKESAKVAELERKMSELDEVKEAAKRAVELERESIQKKEAAEKERLANELAEQLLKANEKEAELAKLREEMEKEQELKKLREAEEKEQQSKLEQREAELAKLRETMDKALKDEKSKRSALEKGQEKVAAVGEKEAFLAESLQKATEELEELRADKERWDQLSATESGMLKEKDEELKARFQQEIVELKAAKEAAFKELEQAKMERDRHREEAFKATTYREAQTAAYREAQALFGGLLNATSAVPRVAAAGSEGAEEDSGLVISDIKVGGGHNVSFNMGITREKMFKSLSGLCMKKPQIVEPTAGDLVPAGATGATPSQAQAQASGAADPASSSAGKGKALE